MRKLICKIADTILRPMKIRAVRASDLREQRHRSNALISLYNSRCLWPVASNKDIAYIVFSMDRALQLHAFLTSFREKVKGQAPVHILYHASSASHHQSYKDLQKIHRQNEVFFHAQNSDNSFKDDLVALISDFNTQRIAFFVDDIIISEEIDMADLLTYDTDKFVPSLRLGLNINQNYTTHRDQPTPPLLTKEAEDDKIVWCWRDGVLDWGYPLSVDGNIFSRREILEIIKQSTFTAPNSLEDAMQDFAAVFQPRLAVAYKKSKLINIPCNKVQNENKNIAGDIHQDELLQKWQAGLSIDLGNIYGYKNTSPHEELPISFTPR